MPTLTLLSADTDDSAYRASVVTRYVTARNEWVELALLGEAARYDEANPDAPPLMDELLGAGVGDVA